MKRFYTTKEVANTIGVGYQTLLRWIYSKHLTEPERIKLGGTSLRLWTKDDIARARKYKVEGKAARRNRQGKGRLKK